MWYNNDMKTISILSAAFLGASQVAAAEEHLLPEDSVLVSHAADSEGYSSLVASSFARVYERDIDLRMIALPSRHPEYAVALGYDADRKYRILVLEPQVMLWNYPVLDMMKSGQIKVVKNAFGKDADPNTKFQKDDEGIAELEAKLPPNPADVKIAVCEAGIDAALAKRIREAWEGVVYRTHYDMPVRDKNGIETIILTSDADNYHFSMGGYGSPGGQIADPEPQSDPGRLLAVALSMRDYCKTSDGKHLTVLGGAIDVLAKSLKSEH